MITSWRVRYTTNPGRLKFCSSWASVVVCASLAVTAKMMAPIRMQITPIQSE